MDRGWWYYPEIPTEKGVCETKWCDQPVFEMVEGQFLCEDCSLARRIDAHDREYDFDDPLRYDNDSL